MYVKHTTQTNLQKGVDTVLFVWYTMYIVTESQTNRAIGGKQNDKNRSNHTGNVHHRRL